MADPADTRHDSIPGKCTVACRRFRVRGRVQGVFFRASTQTVARDLGLGGHAVNCDDGSVEVVACGAREALGKLQQWLADGPAMANVESVSFEEVSCPPVEDFTIG